MKVTAYHGTDRCDFSRFDMKRVEPFNIGLHFGTKAAAQPEPRHAPTPNGILTFN